MRITGKSDDRYLHVGLIVLGISGAAATYLNFEGVSCLVALSRADEQVFTQQSFEELQEKCFVVTNAYVYSLFAVVVGLALIVVWIIKKRRKEP
ncbi:MAG TPA: hypothetical protein VIE86_03340 [Nitrososphaera sp.]|jgi:hypothetical protein